jgi:hypothetical protein
MLLVYLTLRILPLIRLELVLLVIWNQRQNSLLSHWPPSLLSWMRNPSIDWMLGSKQVRDFIQSEEIGWFSLFWHVESYFYLFSLFGRLKDCVNGNLSYMINKLMYVGNM